MGRIHHQRHSCSLRPIFHVWENRFFFPICKYISFTQTLFPYKVAYGMTPVLSKHHVRCLGWSWICQHILTFFPSVSPTRSGTEGPFMLFIERDDPHSRQIGSHKNVYTDTVNYKVLYLILEKDQVFPRNSIRNWGGNIEVGLNCLKQHSVGLKVKRDKGSRLSTPDTCMYLSCACLLSAIIWWKKLKCPYYSYT